MDDLNKTRNAEATKEAILNAAESLFAEKGFAGTSIRDIARQSGASGPLILFHFQSKAGVYEAVKSAIVQRYKPGRCSTAISDLPIQDFLEDLIGSMFAFYRDNPTMMRLANWARLEGEIDPWPGEDELHHAYEEYLRQAQLRGDIRDDIPPMNISAMINGAIHLWWEYHAHFIKHAGEDASGTEVDEAYMKQLLNFVLRGLSPA